MKPAGSSSSASGTPRGGSADDPRVTDRVPLLAGTPSLLSPKMAGRVAAATDSVEAADGAVGQRGTDGADAVGLTPEQTAALTHIAADIATVGAVSDALNVTLQLPDGTAIDAVNATGGGLSVGDVVAWCYRMNAGTGVAMSAMVRNVLTTSLGGPSLTGEDWSVQPMMDTGGLLGFGLDAWVGHSPYDGHSLVFPRTPGATPVAVAGRWTHMVEFDSRVFACVNRGQQPLVMDADGNFVPVPCLSTDYVGVDMGQFAVAGGRLWFAFGGQLWSLTVGGTQFVPTPVTWPATAAGGVGAARLLGNGNTLWLLAGYGGDGSSSSTNWGQLFALDVTEVTNPLPARLVVSGGEPCAQVFSGAGGVDSLGHLVVCGQTGSAPPYAAVATWYSPVGLFAQVPLLSTMLPQALACSASGVVFIGGAVQPDVVWRGDVAASFVPVIARVSPTGAVSLVWVGGFTADSGIKAMAVNDSSQTLSWVFGRSTVFWAPLPQ